LKVENDSPRLLTLNLTGRQPLVLKPGTNEVDDDHWAALMAAHGQKEMPNGKPGFLWTLLDSKQLLVGAEAKKAAVKTEKEMAKAEEKPSGGVPGNVSDAIATVKATTDADKLEEWADTETRKTVLSAIDDQIVSLAALGEAEG